MCILVWNWVHVFEIPCIPLGHWVHILWNTFCKSVTKRDCPLCYGWLYGNQEMPKYSHCGSVSWDLELCKAPKTITFFYGLNLLHEYTLQQPLAMKHLLGAEIRPSSLAKCFIRIWTSKEPSAFSYWGDHNKNKWSGRKEMPSKQHLHQA